MDRPGTDDSEPCPCGRGGSFGALTLGRCCGRYLAGCGGGPAPDVESLMRSRYTAYVLHDVEHLLATWAPSTRPASLDLDDGTRWLGLEILGTDDDHVEFVATYRGPDGRTRRLHERSRFVLRGGHWLYVDGDVS